MNDGICMMLPNKDGSFTRVTCEENKPVCFQIKEDHEMDIFLNIDLGNYVVLEDITNKESIDQINNGSWKLFLDGACTKNGLGIGVIIESTESKIHPHDFKLQFECTNNESEYEILIQGLEMEKNMGIK